MKNRSFSSKDSGNEALPVNLLVFFLNNAAFLLIECDTNHQSTLFLRLEPDWWSTTAEATSPSFRVGFIRTSTAASAAILMRMEIEIQNGPVLTDAGSPELVAKPAQRLN